jgi:hypothetical protein
MRSLKEIQKKVEVYFELKLNTNCRRREYVYARMIYYKLVRNFHPDMSYQKIANTMNKNHGTVLHAIKEFPNVCKFDKQFSKDYNNLKKQLRIISVDITQLPKFENHPLVKYEIKSIRKVFIQRGQNAKRRYELHKTAIS